MYNQEQYTNSKMINQSLVSVYIAKNNLHIVP